MIRLGPAGSEGLGNIKGIIYTKKIGGKAYEVEFTHGIRIREEEAKKIRELGKEYDITISVHAPYFINLISNEKEKRVNSKKRILKSCYYGDIMGAKWIVFHPGFYGKMKKEEAYEEMKKEMGEIADKIREMGLKCNLAPETTGKISQWGDLDETLKIAKELKIGVCIDFAHLKARWGGKIDYKKVVSKLPNTFHSHFSGIEYGPKGEKRHIRVDIKEFEKLIKTILDSEKNITMINESPYIFEDLKKMLKKLKEIKTKI